jgi:hypothetical protein
MLLCNNGLQKNNLYCCIIFVNYDISINNNMLILKGIIKYVEIKIYVHWQSCSSELSTAIIPSLTPNNLLHNDTIFIYIMFNCSEYMAKKAILCKLSFMPNNTAFITMLATFKVNCALNSFHTLFYLNLLSSYLHPIVSRLPWIKNC